jgi:MFS family permease
VITAAGFAPAVVSTAIISLHACSIVGTLFSAWLIARLGSRSAVAVLLIGAALVACGGFKIIEPALGILPWILVFGVAGFFAAAVVSSVYVVAAHAYPASMRSTGIGVVLTASRAGSILSPLILASAMRRGGAPAYFVALGLPMLLGLIGVATVKHHVQRT